MGISANGEKKNICPYCRTVSTCEFSFNDRPYYRCPSCDLIFAERGNDTQSVLNYYKYHYFDDEIVDQLSGQRANLYRHLLDFLERREKIGSLLDVGCGCGFFLKEAKARGWTVWGVDPSEKSVDYARSLLGEAVICGTLDDIPAERRFDVITIINALDHMVDANEQLRKAMCLLAPDGYIYLRFPNGLFHSFFMRLSRRCVFGRFIKSFLIFHEYSLTPRAIKGWLDDLELVEILILNSPLTGGCTFSGPIRGILGNLTWSIFKFLELLSMGRWAWGPSLQIVARKGMEGRRA